jgi:hypothetical protein
MDLRQELEQIQKINWKRHLHTAFMVISDFKVLALIGLSGMTVYGIGWDTVIRPSLETLKSRDTAIKEQTQNLEQKQQLQREYGDLEQKLSNLDTHLLVVHQGTAAKIVSVTEAAELTDLALGKARAANLPVLPAPHNLRENVELKPLDNQSIDIQHPNGDAPAAAASPEKAPDANGPGESPQQAADAPMPVDLYNYELAVTGTYPALMDLLNELVTRKKLVRIKKVTISMAKTQSADIPDAKEYPDYPLKLDMVVTLSLFMYSDNNAAPAPPNP